MSEVLGCVLGLVVVVLTGIMTAFFVLVNNARRIMEIEEKKGEVENEEI